ncbi:helicase [Isoptericola sp. b490]|uniref:helicase n=1 Tax=Actinotalea lenta TaxID=3064654 RepID=UPI002713AB2A|nr:helicase [Isoptericola sp. b490]MDO8119717.1 helicase [Isoptericola sp. b490]
MKADDFVGLRTDLVEHLRRQYLGPSSPEEVIAQRPDRFYLVGTLYPRGRAAAHTDGDVLGDEAHEEGLDGSIELANAWHPASAAISFLHDAPVLSCTLTAGRYEPAPGAHEWRRIPLSESDVRLDADAPTTTVLDGRARLVSVWRKLGDASLVTVALENAATHDDADSPPPTEACLFQVELRCDTLGGAVRPYPSASLLSDDPEEAELRLLYRKRQAFGVGHGCSVTWDPDLGAHPTWVATDMLPAAIVPAVSPGSRADPALRLDHLGDEAVPVGQLVGELKTFVEGYSSWVSDRESETDDLPAAHRDAGARLVGRMARARDRMLEGVGVLESDPVALVAFRLANAAMREQILQTHHVMNHAAVRGVTPDERYAGAEPAWYPFQLAFQLLTIPSTVDKQHVDRSLVELIWFPTGGGKTEAYLALAAFEMIHRRLSRGTRGGGTAVITRYTLRMLTAQQFQRAATLICALELMRKSDGLLDGVQPFSIGLWVGGETTPNDYTTARNRATELRKMAEPENPFQLAACPWCGTPIVPRRRSGDPDAYGVRATSSSFELFCPHADCPFHDYLPVEVVDEQIFAEPPTMLVATVDKFARMPWVRDAGSVVGRGGVPYDPPGLVIQDELHLLSGPLGTTVALYEAAVLGLIGWSGERPKVVASTATIRSAPEQVRSLYGSEVALFPPAGLDADDSYFATKDDEAPGRLYLGLMPQAHTQSYATVLTAVALLEAPMLVDDEPTRLDAYWTLVAYHNSLRELGRTVTIARDDVGSLLTARADARQAPARRLKRNGVIELTSNVPPGQLVKYLQSLEKRAGEADSIDLAATTNMLSVGIDISRLGLMLMNGQPKTTAEYIQATSRVGRSTVPGLVVTLLRAGKPRDRSHYESFKAYHESIYRHVEPTSVTPWSLASRERSLHAALVMLVRHGAGLTANDDAGSFSASDGAVKKAAGILLAAVDAAEPDSHGESAAQLRTLVGEWDRRAREAEDEGLRLRYDSSDKDHPALLRDFGERRDGWETLHSMRSVDRTVRVVAIGEDL